jgi:hypothetical protein
MSKKVGFIKKGKQAFVPGPQSDAVIPRGSREFQNLMRQPQGVYYGPGPQEEQYKSGTTSDTEFYIIWALRQIFKNYPNGGEGIFWDYQKSQQGGRHLPGGSVLDFILWGRPYNIGIRIQGTYWHFGRGEDQLADDFSQKIRLNGGGLVIVDIYEQDFINDPSGYAAIRVVLLAMERQENYNPRAAGNVSGLT